MKTFKVTFREWMYQEIEIIVKANSKNEAIELADNEMHNPHGINERAEWCAEKFRNLKPKVRIKHG